MTIYELIQELTNYPPNTKITFNLQNLTLSPNNDEFMYEEYDLLCDFSHIVDKSLYQEIEINLDCCND